MTLLEDPERARQMGQAGLEMVDQFSARKMVDDIEVLYEDLLAQKSRY